MLALVKKPHTEISLNGEGANAILECLRHSFKVEILNNDDNESVDVFETDFWKNSRVGDFIQGCRLKHELTQKQLAKLSGIPQTVISEYENNKRKVSKKAALQLAKALNEPVEHILSPHIPKSR